MSVVIQPGFIGISEPLDNPRIMYDRRPNPTITVTSSASGFSPEAMRDVNTWNFWRGGAANQTVTCTYSSRSTDYAAIAAHNLGSIGATVSCTVGGTVVATATPEDDSALVFLFNPVVATEVQFVITGASSSPEIAVISIGRALEMPRLSVFTDTPISESKQITYRYQHSLTGDIIGRMAEGAKLEFSLQVNNLPEAFRTSNATVNWHKFLRHVDDSEPFFIAAKPLSYPDDVAYCQAKERPRFVRQTPNAKLSGSITFNCLGYVAP